MPTLFDLSNKEKRRVFAPLADKMRPKTLDEVVGQQDLVAPGAAFRTMIEAGIVPSMIFWGPPGTGKTTLARVVAEVSDMSFVQLSAVTSGVTEVRQTVREAENLLDFRGRRTILFIDEIHRFNKAQQDAFLPCVEDGTMILIGATTENPSFEVNSALLSRCKVFVLQRLEEKDLVALLERALKDPEKGFGKLKLQIEADLLSQIAQAADGDARMALNTLEYLVKTAVADKGSGTKKVTKDGLRVWLQRSHLLYDRQGEEHYNIISALHKSMRGSDADAALYWLGRMLEGGEDPLYVARRLVRFASEDIGLADPQALVQATAAYQASHYLGMPECNVILSQCVAYLARAKKSNALYEAYSAVKSDIQNLPNEPVPLHLRNAPTALMKELDYGKGYKYNPAFDHPVEQDYLPVKLKGRKYLK